MEVSAISVASESYRPVPYMALKPKGIAQEIFSDYAPFNPPFKFKEHEYFGRAYNELHVADIYISQDEILRAATTNVAGRISALNLRVLNFIKRRLVDRELRKLRAEIAYFKERLCLAQDVPPDLPLAGVIDLTHAENKQLTSNDRNVVERVKIVTKDLFTVRYVLKLPKEESGQVQLLSEVSFIASFDKKVTAEERALLIQTPIPAKIGFLMRYYNQGSLNRCIAKFSRVQKLSIAASLAFQLHLISTRVRGSYTDIKPENVLVHITPQTETSTKIIAHFADFERCFSIPDPELVDSAFLEEIKSIRKWKMVTSPVTRHAGPVQEISDLMSQINRLRRTEGIPRSKAPCKRLHTVTNKQQQFAFGCIIYQLFTGLRLKTMGEMTKPHTLFVETKPAVIAEQLETVEPFIRDIIFSLLDLNKHVDLLQLSEELKASPEEEFELE